MDVLAPQVVDSKTLKKRTRKVLPTPPPLLHQRLYLTCDIASCCPEERNEERPLPFLLPRGLSTRGVFVASVISQPLHLYL